MDNIHNTQPATDAGTPDTGTPDTGTPDTGTLLQPADLPRYVAVCDNGDLLPLSVAQFRDNWLERGPKIGEQFDRHDIAFVCTAKFAEQWPTRESVVEHVAQTRAQEARDAKTAKPAWTPVPFGSLPHERPAHLHQLRLELATIQPAAIRGDEATVTEWKELALKIARLESEIELEAIKNRGRNNQ